MEPQVDPQVEPEAAMLSKEVRNWAMLCHIASFSAIFTGIGMIVGPLIVWLLKKEEHPFIDEQGKEALNFNISITIYMIASAILILVVIGVLLLIVISIFWFVITIIAAVNASSGNHYQYPLTIRFVK